MKANSGKSVCYGDLIFLEANAFEDGSDGGKGYLVAGDDDP